MDRVPVRALRPLQRLESAKEEGAQHGAEGGTISDTAAMNPEPSKHAREAAEALGPCSGCQWDRKLEIIQSAIDAAVAEAVAEYKEEDTNLRLITAWHRERAEKAERELAELDIRYKSYVAEVARLKERLQDTLP